MPAESFTKYLDTYSKRLHSRETKCKNKHSRLTTKAHFQLSSLKNAPRILPPINTKKYSSVGRKVKFELPPPPSNTAVSALLTLSQGDEPSFGNSVLSDLPSQYLQLPKSPSEIIVTSNRLLQENSSGGDARLTSLVQRLTPSRKKKPTKNPVAQCLGVPRTRWLMMAKRINNKMPLPRRRRSNNKQLTSFDVARNILFHKMENLHDIRQSVPRLVEMPSLAAPCSEEFAITLRRIRNGKGFIPTPEVLSHTAKKTNHISSAIALLDAVVRPPSTPMIS